jgi:hypothetical protein
MSKQEELREALSILKNLLRTVNAVCGVVRFANGTSGLAVDRNTLTWARSSNKQRGF